MQLFLSILDLYRLSQKTWVAGSNKNLCLSVFYDKNLFLQLAWILNELIFVKLQIIESYLACENVFLNIAECWIGADIQMILIFLKFARLMFMKSSNTNLVSPNSKTAAIQTLLKYSTDSSLKPEIELNKGEFFCRYLQTLCC